MGGSFSFRILIVAVGFLPVVMATVHTNSQGRLIFSLTVEQGCLKARLFYLENKLQYWLRLGSKKPAPGKINIVAN